MRPQLGHDRGPDRQVRHKVAVHDIDVDPVASQLHQPGAFCAEFGEVGGEDRGGDARGGAHVCCDLTVVVVVIAIS